MAEPGNAPRSCVSARPMPRRRRIARRLRRARLAAPLALALGLVGCVQIQLFGGKPEPLRETTLEGDTGPKILLIKIDGVISMDPPTRRGLFTNTEDNSVSRLREVLSTADADPEVKALLLRIDSPGGSASASDVVYNEILRFKREHRVPVVAQLMGTAASGGYYVAMAADHVVAHPTSVSGSIGVIFMGVNLSGLMEKLGILDQTIVAGRYKDAGSPLRRMRPEERAHFQAVVDDLHTVFQAVVVAGRPGLDAAQVAKLADGRIFSARQALEAGLVDEVGGLEHAIQVTRQRMEVPRTRVVTYHRNDEYENNIYTRRLQAAEPLRIELPAPFDWLTQPGFYYLWTPGLGGVQ